MLRQNEKINIKGSDITLNKRIYTNDIQEIKNILKQNRHLTYLAIRYQID